MIKRSHICYICKKVFDTALYWYDSLHDTKYNKRIIRPFCGPPCAHKYRDTTDVNDYPQRRPLPHGPEWQIIDNIDFINYESD